ncbi:hypothetical protein COCC4DRAFT_29177 [Bipolaris maydis ATCC 48331]|uniref:HD/PDEase domain-containing protein n=2 Tax=Cochliobolus heterostrophus TaxID=5016 RepID=M2TD66_COCH5|nr:uncharacterized protein COCC4DRAFT_29177 [Bipolaris maydis ATCC 48331]EMD95415.1 hypothetical protein COCHEDRAFT_1019188 [Bipolaris maydis C5]KAH7561387.1 hypothetical protein BM1_02491 [Bipolaris maydis]ENI10278.1 hypothetical protein COCC4DRAFT_29177 [Bipolaris maydis ATCC 48331]KAJ5030188.1 hypothetical protein J3E73DRAFT_274893 [Bipolaris maydis]KAJ5065190.1 hypothetical protein J3E74DRAFT_300148 [Bipolaris maydis]
MCPPSDLASAAVRETGGVPDHYPFEASLDTPISKAAYTHAASILHPSILNHSIRVFKYADEIAKHTSSKYFTDPHQRDLLFTACLLHDIGTTQEYNGPQRFEVEGADAAVKHLSHFGVSKEDAHCVWTAIACHTSPGIAERIGELSRIVRIAVITDFRRIVTEWSMLEAMRERLEAQHERVGIEKVLGDAVVEQAKMDPRKAPKVSWPHAMYAAWLADPDWDGVNKAF